MQTDEERIKQLTEQLTKKLNNEQEAEETTTDTLKDVEKNRNTNESVHNPEEETIYVAPQQNDSTGWVSENAEEDKNIIIFIKTLVFIGASIIVYYMVTGQTKEEKYGVGVGRVYDGISNKEVQIKNPGINVFGNEVDNVEKELELLEKVIPVDPIIEGEALESEAKKELGDDLEKKDTKEEKKTEAVKAAEEILDLDGDNKLGRGL